MKTTFAPVATWGLPWLASLMISITIVYLMTAAVLGAEVPTSAVDTPTSAFVCESRQDDRMLAYAVSTQRVPAQLGSTCLDSVLSS
jgi:hypothetical protein